jgi:hypothetical protein
MRMLQPGSGIRAVVLENRDVVGALVCCLAGYVALYNKDAQDLGDVLVRQHSHITGVVGTIDSDFVNPKPSMRRRRCSKLRLGWASLESAAKLLGSTRTAQGSPTSVGNRTVSGGGVLFSFPGQNPQVSRQGGRIFA